jgi:hypothetical protein
MARSTETAPDAHQQEAASAIGATADSREAQSWQVMTCRKGAELCRNLIAAHRVMRIARLPADWQIAVRRLCRMPERAKPESIS